MKGEMLRLRSGVRIFFTKKYHLVTGLPSSALTLAAVGSVTTNSLPSPGTWLNTPTWRNVSEVKITDVYTGKHLQSFQQGAFAMETTSHNERDSASDAKPPNAAAVGQL